MTKVITKKVLRKKLSNINQQQKIANNIRRSAANDKSTSNNIILTEKKITRIRGNDVITSDGLSSPLYSPLPCLYWKCSTKADTDGVQTLQKALTGLFIEDQDSDLSYCIGVTGYSNEFELRVQLEDQEVRFNNQFLNINVKHLVKNGLEEKI